MRVSPFRHRPRNPPSSAALSSARQQPARAGQHRAEGPSACRPWSCPRPSQRRCSTSRGRQGLPYARQQVQLPRQPAHGCSAQAAARTLPQPPAELWTRGGWHVRVHGPRHASEAAAQLRTCPTCDSTHSHVHTRADRTGSSPQLCSGRDARAWSRCASDGAGPCVGQMPCARSCMAGPSSADGAPAVQPQQPMEAAHGSAWPG